MSFLMRCINRLRQNFSIRVLMLGMVMSVSPAYSFEQQNTQVQSHPSLEQQIKDFAKELAKEGFDQTAIEKQLTVMRPNQKILSRIRKPAESLSWHQYRKIFIQKERIDAGVAFFKQHRNTLARAQNEFHVDGKMIAAIIGIETFYGRHKGTFPVLEALYTLGFHYPKRAPFFRKELKSFYLLARAQNWPLDKIKGSYAGAMGMGQFIPSSYQHYAIDYDGDGKIDLFHSVDDMIGSVANYFYRHGWRDDQFLAIGFNKSETDISQLAQNKLKLSLSYREIASAINPNLTHRLSEHQNEKFAVYAFRLNQGREYWLTGKNFYAITRYNRSKLYARAAVELSRLIGEGLD